jgi:hypothetical protein
LQHGFSPDIEKPLNIIGAARISRSMFKKLGVRNSTRKRPLLPMRLAP